MKPSIWREVFIDSGSLKLRHQMGEWHCGDCVTSKKPSEDKQALPRSDGPKKHCIYTGDIDEISKGNLTEGDLYVHI